MTWSGSDIVIIAARRPVAVALEAVLHDWMVQGLVDPCRVVDLDSMDDAIPAKLLERGLARTVLLHEDLAHTRVTRVRLVVVGVVDEESTSVTSAQSSAILSAVRQSVPGVPYTQLSVTAGSPGAQWASRAVPLYGWHNLAVSPEESLSPSQGSAPIANSSSDPRWLLHLTGTLCSLTGLWPGQRTSPFDEQPPPSGGLIVPVRAFSRSLSSGSVQDGLASRLIQMDDRYPTPQVDRNFAIAIDNEADAAMGFAEQLLAKHRDVLPRERLRSQPPLQVKIGAWEAVKRFISFAALAIVNAPRRALGALEHALSQATASAVQNAVFGGADSGFAVVVRGVRADGSSASWAEYEQSLDSVIRRVSPQSGELPAVPQKPQLWTDFVDGGLTLLDAGNRVAELPPRTHGSQRAVITTTDTVAADPSDVFELPANLAAFLSEWRIEAGDDIAITRLFNQLDKLAQTQPHLSQTIGNERNRLREWATRIRASYAGHVGQRLGAAHQATITEVRELTAALEKLSAAPQVPADIQAEQDRLASDVQVMTGVAVSLLAILTALSALSVFAWPYLVAGVLLVLLGWVAYGTTAEMKTAQKVHALIHRLRAAETELQDAQRHRLEALEDLRRLSRAYRQYLDWSRALGAFIHAPLGHRTVVAQRDLHVGQGMPLNVSIGVAVPDQQAIDDVTNRWRGKLFRAGWLTEAWREFSTDLPPNLGELRHRIQQEPALLRNDPPLDGVPVLTQWSRAVAATAAQRPMPAETYGRIVELTRTDDAARERLLGRVRVRDGHGRALEQPRAAFVEGLDRADQPGALQPGMFDPAGADVDVRRVQHTLTQNDSAGLDVALVVIQLGGALDPSLLAGASPTQHQTRRLEPSAVDEFI